MFIRLAKNYNKPKPTAPAISSAPPVTDRTNWYADLSYFPSEYKEGRVWMSQSLFFAKQNSQVLQDREPAEIYRQTDKGYIDPGLLKQMIDPPTSKGKGGKAEYFSADGKALPIDAHLDNIMDANIRTIPLKLNCSLADPIAKLREQKDKEKIINQRFVRNIINDFSKDLGLPPISESTDPYKWIQNFTSKGDKPKEDEIGSAIDQIRTKIKDDDGLRLFQNYLYKNGLEVAFENGIKYYLLDQNEWDVKYSQEFLRDLKHFNKISGRWAIDETSGQGTVKYIDPTKLYTSPFRDKNGDDIIYFYYEEDVTMAEFERLVGTEMTYEEKKKALKIQKDQGWISGGSNNSNKNNSQIRLGFFSVLTQEATAFAEKYINDTTSIYEKKDLTWQPEPDEGEKVVKVYNVWYSCYYLPLSAWSYSNNQPVNWEEQSRYIFHINKDTDMMRYGPDKRYAKSSLIVYKNDKQLSWTDIKQAFMPKINLMWQKFQNCIVQDVSGLALDEDLLGAMLNAVDEANTGEKGGGDAVINEWKMLRQAGLAWFKFRDKNGNLVVQDPAKLFVSVDSGHMKRALEIYLPSILQTYNLLTQALANGQSAEGIQPSARTPLGGIQIAKDASVKSTYFIEQAYIEGVVVPFGMRCAQHIHAMAKENKTFNFKKRWQQFTDVVGSYNGAVIESIEDINFENIGLTIKNADDSAKRELIVQQIVQRYAQKQLSTSAFGLVLDTDNWKLQIVELSMEEQKAQEKAEKQAEIEHQRAMELQQAQLETAKALNQAKADGKNSNIMTEGKVQSMLDQQLKQLKDDSMAKQKDQLLHNKLIQDQQKAELDKDKKSHEANLEAQKPLV